MDLATGQVGEERQWAGEPVTTTISHGVQRQVEGRVSGACGAVVHRWLVAAATAGPAKDTALGQQAARLAGVAG